jgi:hypothetical protein
MLETIISLFSAIGAFGNVTFLTVAAGVGRVLNADRNAQKDLATNVSRSPATVSDAERTSAPPGCEGARASAASSWR